MLKDFLKTCAVFSAVNVCAIGAAEAATVTIQTMATSPYQTVYGIREDTTTRGSDLIGALVHAIYADGTEEDLTFEEVGNNVTSKVVGSGFDLSFTLGGNLTRGPLRLLASSAIASLEFFLAPVGSVFDIAGGNLINTPGSKVGFPFQILSGNDGLVGDITATYSGIVNLAGSDAYGDLYTNMLVDFSGLEGGGFLGEMVFRTDLDTLHDTSDLAPVPLPAGLPLLIAGLGGLGLVGRRRKKAA